MTCKCYDSYHYEKKYNELSDQCVTIRDLIPEVVNGVCTDSIVSNPLEVLGFAIEYIKELQKELEMNNK